MYHYTYPVGTPDPQDVAIARMRRRVGPNDAAATDVLHFYPHPHPSQDRAACGHVATVSRDHCCGCAAKAEHEHPDRTGCERCDRVQGTPGYKPVIVDALEPPPMPLCSGCFRWVESQREYEARVQRAARD